MGDFILPNRFFSLPFAYEPMDYVYPENEEPHPFENNGKYVNLGHAFKAFVPPGYQGRFEFKIDSDWHHITSVYLITEYGKTGSPRVHNAHGDKTGRLFITPQNHSSSYHYYLVVDWHQGAPYGEGKGWYQSELRVHQTPDAKANTVKHVIYFTDQRDVEKYGAITSFQLET